MIRGFKCSLFWLVLLSGVVSITIARAAAQVPGGSASLSIKIMDPSGAVIVKAKASFKGEKGPVHTRETDQKGQAVFSNLTPGKYQLQVEAEGFEHVELKDVTLKPGNNVVDLHLEIAEIKVDVAVTTDPRESATDPRGTAFTTILTQEQIANLPDDPEQLDAVLREMAGPGAVIRVNGFSGGRLPPKSQIREIRFKLNPYAPENHEPGLVSVDIFTRPGTDTWHGTFNFGFRDESLAARNTFAPFRGPEQYRRFGLALDGPLLAKRTSLFLTAEGALSFDSKTIVAAVPAGAFSALVPVPARLLNLSSRIEHVLTKYHTLRAEYQRNASAQNNLGVGNFDLPERAFSSTQVEHLLRVSDTGPFYKRFVNEVRFQMRWQNSDLLPANFTPAIQVLNAFNSGGAQVNSSRQVRQVEFVDNLDFAVGKHAMKVGLVINRYHETTDERRNANGTFVFSSLDDFSAGRPITFTQRLGSGPISFSQYRFGGFWQDDLRLHKSMTISFGLRYDFQSNVKNRKNFAPRLGLVWSPFANGQTTIRAGGGIFYDWLDTDTYLQTLLVDGQHQTDLVIRNPGFPDPFSGSSITVLPPSLITLAPDLRLPYIQQWSIGLERPVAEKYLVRANYLYQRGVHLIRGHNINVPVGAVRPDPAAGNINQVESSANSTLTQFNISFSPQALRSTRIYWIVNYTWSKAVNETDGPLSLPANNFDLAAERGPSIVDSRHRLFVISNFRILNSLRLGTILRATSATPYNITTGFDDNGDTAVNDRPVGVGRNSARGAAQVDLSARLSWTIGFGKIPAQKAESGQPTVIRTRNSADALGALSSIGSDSRYGMQFYLQAFNVLNHANLVNFTGVQTSPFFGHATSALPARRLEVGVRFSF